MLALFVTLLMGALSISAVPVHIISSNLEQTLTSSTLQWVSTDGKDPGLLEYAVVAAYQIPDDTNRPESPEGNDNDIIRHHPEPIYICRAQVTGVWVTGQLRPKNHVCVASLYKKVEEYHQFEVLINIDHSARLSWVGKNKYVLIPPGAVTSGGENRLRTYVARRPNESHNKSGSLTHYVGTFNPSENLGVYHLVDEHNNEMAFEEGEILVETEPVAYEFRQVKFKRTGRRFPKKKQILAQTVLKNDESGLQKVDSVMTYQYEYFVSWGKGHGMLTALPFSVYLPSGEKQDGIWALPKPTTKEEVLQVEKYLEEGTAVNVSLVGNWTELEVPYTATVVAIYKDGERLEFTIQDTKRENKVVDVAFDFSPVYFLNNNSFVPTTTTTTTTTTSTTTTRTTSSTTQEATPMAPPEVVMRGKPDLLHADNKRTEQSNVEDSTLRLASIEKKTDSSSSTSGATSLALFSVLPIMGTIVLRLA